MSDTNLIPKTTLKGGSKGLAALLKSQNSINFSAAVIPQDVGTTGTPDKNVSESPKNPVPLNSSNATIDSTPNIRPSGEPSPKPMVKNSGVVPIIPATPKCAQCSKTVYKVEELLAISKLWHKSCFTCGGTASDGCGRVLTLDKYLDHDNQPYCNACYSKLFRPKGYGYGNTLNTDYGSTEKSLALSVDEPSSEPLASSPYRPSPPLPPPVNATVASASSTIENTPNIKPSGKTDTPSDLPRAPKPSHPPPTSSSLSVSNNIRVSTKPVAPVASKPLSTNSETQKKNSIASSIPNSPKCPMCTKSVYKNEELQALSRIWHKSCFTCGGSAKVGCGRVLTLDKYLDHDNQPFCNACYSKLYRPKGFGYGNTLNTDFGSTGETEVLAAKVALSSIISEPDNTNKHGKVDPMANTVPSSAPANVIKSVPSVPKPVPTLPTLAQSNASLPTKAVTIGNKTGNTLHQEATYSGNSDEVDESEW